MVPPNVQPLERRPDGLLPFLRCDGEPSTVGGAGFGADTAPDLEAALAAFIDTSGFVDRPMRGYVLAGHGPDWAVYVYPVASRIRAAVLIEEDPNHGGGWSAADYRTCDPSEYDAADLPAELHVWLDAEGRPVPTWRVRDFAGPSHCDWQSVTFLSVGVQPGGDDGRRQYLRDPDGIFAAPDAPGRLLASFEAGVELPIDAAETGWHRGPLAIWTVPGDAAVYVTGGPDGTERWPRAGEQIGCL